MSSLLKITVLRPLRSHLRPCIIQVQRPLHQTTRLTLRETKEQSPETLEKAKQEQMKGGSGTKSRELQSEGEEAVGADQEKVKDDKKHMEELQKETANESQREHPEGK